MKHKIPYPFSTQKIWRLCYHKTYYFYENLRTFRNQDRGMKAFRSSISCAVIFDLARYLTAVKIINSCNAYGAHCTICGNFCFHFFFRTWSPSVKLSHRLEQAILVAPKTQSLLKWWRSMLCAIFIHNPWQSNLIPRGPKGCIVNVTLDERTPLVPLPSNTKKEIGLTDRKAKRGNAIIFHLQITQTVISSVSSSFASLITN